MNVQIISFHCVLKNQMGRVLSSTYNHDVITSDATEKNMLVGLAEGLRDLRKGERRRIFLRADQAYGFYDPKKVIEKSLDEIPAADTLRVGEQVLLDKAEGLQPFRVTEILGDRVILDSNHPLAGQDLVFEIEALDAREPTVDELLEIRSPNLKPNFH